MRVVAEARAAATVRGLWAALDMGDFQAVRRCLDPVVEVDAGALWKTPPLRLNADDLVENWRGVIGGLDGVRHDLGPVRAAVGGDRAETTCSADIRYFLGERMWRVSGAYHISLARGAGWRIQRLCFEMGHEEGDRELLAAARLRTARSGSASGKIGHGRV
ncbi:MAG: hypothetical protein ACI8U3_001244 [Brevundimonas sp.]|jgi:hypothetical protein|uniref:nuclear transport factor 2 family protein n=1 Tax=Brevundimonas sp. TaxID=1871086 RepID=UPI0039E52B26